MIYRWVFEGTLEDPFGEFFVAANAAVNVNELWHKKYTLREDMRPSFISRPLADKVFPFLSICSLSLSHG